MASSKIQRDFIHQINFTEFTTVKSGSLVGLYYFYTMRIFALALLTIAFFPVFAQKISEKPIPVAHAHNDYNKRNPLWGALKNGFTSIEIDVFAHKNELKVAHVGLFLNARKNLDEMYLKPLADLLQTKDWVYNNYNEPLILMIDFKTDSESTLPLLLNYLAPYENLLTFYSENEVHKKPLQIVISGSRFTQQQIENMDTVYIFRDGSIQNCTSDFASELEPRGSTRYGSKFSWNGKGKMPDNERLLFREYFAKAENCDKKLRLYGMKNRKNLWKNFLDEGMGWVNVDKKKKFARFYWNEYLTENSLIEK